MYCACLHCPFRLRDTRGQEWFERGIRDDRRESHQLSAASTIKIWEIGVDIEWKGELLPADRANGATDVYCVKAVVYVSEENIDDKVTYSMIAKRIGNYWGLALVDSEIEWQEYACPGDFEYWWDLE